MSRLRCGAARHQHQCIIRQPTRRRRVHQRADEWRGQAGSSWTQRDGRSTKTSFRVSHDRQMERETKWLKNINRPRGQDAGRKPSCTRIWRRHTTDVGQLDLKGPLADGCGLAWMGAWGDGWDVDGMLGCIEACWMVRPIPALQCW